MGLDMYLHAHKYYSGASWSSETEVRKHKSLMRLTGAGKFSTEKPPSIEVKVEVAYWRKAQTIHNWFVQHVQGGDDNCEEHRMRREQLEELVETCKGAIKSATVAAETLPAGYYDSYYRQALIDTVKKLELVLKNTPDDWDFSYRSSW